MYNRRDNKGSNRNKYGKDTKNAKPSRFDSSEKNNKYNKNTKGNKKYSSRDTENRYNHAKSRKIEEPSLIENEVIETTETPEAIDKLEGRNAVLEALKSGVQINKLMIAKGDVNGSIKQIIAMAKEKGIIVTEVDKSKLDELSTSRSHQGVIAMISPVQYVEIDDILDSAKEKGEQPFIIILDEITDPNNLGSILRTANAVGAHGVVIPKRRSIAVTPTVAKVSAGAVLYVPVARVTNLPNTIDYLKEQGLWIIGTDMSGEQSFYESDLTGPVAIVIGSEGKGMGRLVMEKCDFVVNLPMHGEIASLNAGVAGGIVMYEIFKQRKSKQ